MIDIVDKNLQEFGLVKKRITYPQKMRYLMQKKLIVIAVVATMLFGIFGIAGCMPEEDEIVPKGTFYSLQEAYDDGLLTVENLQSIADYHNNGISYPEELDDFVSESVKMAWAESLRTNETYPRPEANAEEIVITKYYGTYNNCIVIILDYGTHAEISIPVTDTVGGVSFNYGHPRYSIVCWKQITK
jgi:hypothetical protein